MPKCRAAGVTMRHTILANTPSDTARDLDTAKNYSYSKESYHLSAVKKFRIWVGSRDSFDTCYVKEIRAAELSSNVQEVVAKRDADTDQTQRSALILLKLWLKILLRDYCLAGMTCLL